MSDTMNKDLQGKPEGDALSYKNDKIKELEEKVAEAQGHYERAQNNTRLRGMARVLEEVEALEELEEAKTELEQAKSQAKMAAAFKHYANIAENQAHAEETAAGKTDDTTPEELSQVERFSFVETEATEIAKDVFVPDKPKCPAEHLVLAELYDNSQSHNRILRLYKMTRADFYAQAKNDLAARQNRIKQKEAIFLSIEPVVAKAIAMQIGVA